MGKYVAKVRPNQGTSHPKREMHSPAGRLEGALQPVHRGCLRCDGGLQALLLALDALQEGCQWGGDFGRGR